jgi:hypothetical protein
MDKAKIVAEFELRKEGADKLTYAETYPRGVVGNFYLARLAAYYQWEGIAPQRIRVTVERIPGE